METILRQIEPPWASRARSCRCLEASGRLRNVLFCRCPPSLRPRSCELWLGELQRSGHLPVAASSHEVEDAAELSVWITATALQLDGRDRRDVGVASGKPSQQLDGQTPYHASGMTSWRCRRSDMCA